MPGTDMKIQQLKAYKGSYPAPDDFQEFWKQVMNKVSTRKALHMTQEEIPFRQKNLKCYRIRITAEDHCCLSAKYIRPAKAGKLPLMIQFHDYPMASRSWFYLSRYASIGYGVLAPDCRGQAGESENGMAGKGPLACGPMFQGLEDTLKNMYLYHLIEDALLWITAAKSMEGVDTAKISVYGEGQGGGLAIACAAMYSDVVKCAAHYPMLCDYYRVWEKDFDVNAYEGLRYFFRWHDPLHRQEKEIFQKLSYFDVKNFAPMVQADTLISTGLQDAVSPPSAQFAIVNQMKCPKKHLIYPKHGHELNNFFENELLKFLLTEKM